MNSSTTSTSSHPWTHRTLPWLGGMACCLFCLTALPAFAETLAEEEEDAAEESEVVVEGEEPIYELDPVVVTATRAETDVTTAPASVSVITSEELKKAPVGDLTDAIRDVPGISLSAGTQGRRTINIRGMGSAYTLILVDGKRVNSNEAIFRHNDMDISVIPVEAIERVEVVRGSMSSLYGSEALGGVINIITKPVSDVWTAGIDAKGQMPTHGADGQELRTSVYASGPLIEGKLGLRLSGAFDQRMPWHGLTKRGEPLLDSDGNPVLRSDGSPVSRGDISTLEGRRDHNGRATLVWTPDRNQSIKAEYGQAYHTREGEYYILATTGRFTYGVADSATHRRDAVLSHDGNWSWGRTHIQGYWEGIETEQDELRQGNWVLEGNTGFFLGAHALTLGFESRWTDLDAPDFTSGHASVSQHAVYAQDDFAITDTLALLVGARLDHHETFGFHPTPRSYLVYTPLPELTLKGGVGTGFRAPTLRQISTESETPSCRGACVIRGNPDLDPETAVTYEISAGWETRVWGVSAAIFQNDVSNLIDTPRGAGVDPIGFTDTDIPVYVPRNVNEARMRGIEATAHARLTRTVGLRANYTLLDARDLDQDVELDNRPRHTVNGQVDWKVGDVDLFVRGQYIGDQKSGEETIDGYALFDLGASYRPFDSFGLNVGILNVADTRTDTFGGYSYQERGRTLFVGMNARY